MHINKKTVPQGKLKVEDTCKCSSEGNTAAVLPTWSRSWLCYIDHADN